MIWPSGPMRRELRTDCTRGRETVSSPRSVASAYKPEVREIVRVSEYSSCALPGSPDLLRVNAAQPKASISASR
jgi:hypothetical protein